MMSFQDRGEQLTGEKLIVVLRGGLGNQLIQRAFAASLCQQHGLDSKSIVASDLLLGSIITRLARNTVRSKAFEMIFVDSESTLDLVKDILENLSQGRRVMFITDQRIKEISERGLGRRKPVRLVMYGYFQHKDAFGESSLGFWDSFLESVSHGEMPHKKMDRDRVAVHIRCGDYRGKYRRVYQLHSTEKLVRAGLEISGSYSNTKRLAVFTDSPSVVQREIPKAYRQHVEFKEMGSAEKDLLALSEYSRIIGSNSTFSLCAGMLSSRRWGKASTLYLPSEWYTDKKKNREIISSLRELSFTRIGCTST